MNSQITIFEDDFESYDDFTITNFGDWVKFDIDGENTWGVFETDFPHEGEPMAGIIFNPFTCTTDVSSASNYSPIDGSTKYFTFWTVGTSGSISDDYLVTPMIDLQNVTDPTLTFYAKSLASTNSSSITPEQFEVLLSTTGNAVSDFTVNLGGIESNQREGHTWDQYTRDLTPYIGQQVYIAIHYISPDTSYALHFDDFKVNATSVAGINDYNSLDFSIYPNPTKNTINIKTEGIIDTIIVSNILGEIFVNINPDSNETRIDINKYNLGRGIYFVKVRSGKNTRTSKIIVE